ncbi:MarR family winged helix-turn-helix transcriptional regulator [Nocardia alni]|uniref:MarR family winged helix-turn-helix transcriptional regulator n=1 Tax=Nocardia alni TaxID=2815723 RepID=UPI001C24AC7C|nr:MarR family transcriptional regulator [Nocardia alni]
MASSPERHDYVDGMMVVAVEDGDDRALQAKALAYRLRRLAHRLETDIKRELAPHGVELWELELLACLIRAEPGHRLSAGQLVTQLQLTTGAVTNRVRQLEEKGWVTRDFDPADRRSVLVALTPAGEKRAMEVFAVKTDTECRLLSVLSAATQRRINDDLRKVLLNLET